MRLPDARWRPSRGVNDAQHLKRRAVLDDLDEGLAGEEFDDDSDLRPSPPQSSKQRRFGVALPEIETSRLAGLS